MENETKTNSIENIAEYIRNLKFKKAVVGGIDQENVYSEIRTLITMFNEAYNDIAKQKSEAEKQVQDVKKELEDERSQNEARLRSIEEQTIQHLEKSRAENKELKKRLDAVNTDGEARAQRKVSALEGDIEKLEDSIKELTEENFSLKAQLSDTQSKFNEMTFRNETLEEIYIDANRKRTEMIQKANEDASAIIKEAEVRGEEIKMNAEKENNELISKNQQIKDDIDALENEIETKRATMMDECNKEVAEIKSENEKACSELIRNAETKSEEILNKAKAEADAIAETAKANEAETIAKANEQAEEIITKAKTEAEGIKFDAESRIAASKALLEENRTKFNSIVTDLNSVRAEAIEKIQKDIDRMQGLASALSDNNMELLAEDK